MTDDVGPGLDVTADLRLDIDGVRAQITGRGSDLTVRTRSPLRLLRAARTAPQPTRSVAAWGAALRALSDAGITLTVSDDVGDVARLGAGVPASAVRRALRLPPAQLAVRELARRRTVRTLAAAVAVSAVLKVMSGRRHESAGIGTLRAAAPRRASPKACSSEASRE